MTEKNKQGFKIVISYIVMWIAVIILQVIMVIPYVDSAGNIDIPEATELRMISITNIVLYLSLFILFVYMLRAYLKDQIIQTKNNLRQFLKLTAIGLVALFIAVYASAIVMEILGVVENSENQDTLNSLMNAAVFDQVVLVIFSVFLAPFVEEIVFRKAIYGFLEKVNVPLAIIVSGLSFGFIHVLSGDYVQLIIYGSLGLVLAFFYYFSKKSILTVVAIHMIYNLLITIILFTL